MRLFPIESVTPGMRVAAPFFNQHGDLLLRTGTTLTEPYIALLHRRGARGLWIDDPDTADIVVDDALSERTRGEAMGKIGGLFEAAQKALTEAGGSSLVQRYRQSTEFIQMMSSLPYWDIADVVNSIVDEAVAADPVQSLLGVLKTADTYQFAHAVDTAVAAATLGSRVKLDRGSVRRLVRGCLLHDIGMVLIDPEVVGKPGRLTAEEHAQVELHPALGYEFLNRVHKDDIIANHIAFQHHERQDGKGYPRGLVGNNSLSREGLSPGKGRILFLAEIAAVVDVYDALRSDRPHRPALPSDLALNLLRRAAGSWLNAEVVKEFARFVPPYPVATEVVVVEGASRGSVGVVCKVDPDDLERPVIRLLTNAHGERIAPVDLDLRRAPTITIRALMPVPSQPRPQEARSDHAADGRAGDHGDARSPVGGAEDSPVGRGEKGSGD